MNKYMLGVLMLTGLTSLAAAQEEVTLGEVIVTAQRREQNLQEVPVSVTAFTADAIARGNISSAAEYLSLTPNIAFSDGDNEVGSRGIRIAIRGVNELTTGESSVIGSVGVYLDEFSVVSVPNNIVNPQLVDLERIEVLRGPEGTYFGRNALGGALNLSTKKPQDEFGFKIELGGRDFEDAGEQGELSAILNLPVTESFATRAVVYYEDSSGLVENINPSGVDTGHEYLMGRLSALWTPTENTAVNFAVMYADEEQQGDETVPSGVWNVDTVDGYRLGVTNLIAAVNPSGIGFFPANQNKTSRDLDEYAINDSLIAILNIAYRFGDEVVFKSITGVIDAKSERLFDDDQLGGWDNFFRENKNEGLSYSSELRMEMTKEGFDWILGGLYAQDDQERRTDVVAGTQTAAPVGPFGADPAGVVLLPPIPFGFCFLCEDRDFENESAAVFSDFTWHATDRLDLTAGGRFTRDDISTAVVGSGPTLQNRNPLRSAQADRRFEDFSPRFVARYEFTDDFSGYGKISKGYKAGGTTFGFNPTQPAVIVQQFEDERVWSYEIGLKSESLNRRLRINAAAFHLEWSDLQLEVFRFLIPGNLQSKFALITNLGKAEASGVELEFAAAVSERFTLSGGVGYLDTEIKEADPQILSGDFVVNLEGLDIPKSPPLTANLVGDYRWPLTTGEASIRAEYLYRDGQLSNVEALVWPQTRGRFVPARGTSAFLPATPDGFPFQTPDYSVVNLRVGYERNNVAFALFVENAFDEEYYTGTNEDFSITGIRIHPHPRIYGATVSYSFGGI